MAAGQSFTDLQTYYMNQVSNGLEPFTDGIFKPITEESIIGRKRLAAGDDATNFRKEIKTLESSGYLKWMRAPQLAQKHGLRPQLVENGLTQFDVNQGSVGNCWFIAGAIQLADREDLFRQVVPSDQGFGKNYAGVFHFYLWWYGKWTEVIVDDYIPCINLRQNGWTPLFLRNYKEKNEFWAPLLEKAYAKLNGSYEEIIGGFSRWSMVDVTGGLGLYRMFTDNDVRKSVFFDTIQALMKYDTLLGCGAASDWKGLQSGHAYAVLDVVKVKERTNSQEHELVLVKNPHGSNSSEWSGDWSDKDYTNWKKLTQSDQLLYNRQPDGQFWMSLDDFMTFFGRLDICLVPPLNPGVRPYSKRDKKPGWTISTSGRTRWIPGQTSGGPPFSELFWTNPQFRFFLCGRNRSSMFICLTRITTESNPDYDGTGMNFVVLSLDDHSQTRLDQDALSRRAFVRFLGEIGTRGREVWQVLDLDPGYYCIIPFLAYPNAAEDFVLRVASEMDVLVREL